MIIEHRVRELSLPRREVSKKTPKHGRIFLHEMWDLLLDLVSSAMSQERSLEVHHTSFSEGADLTNSLANSRTAASKITISTPPGRVAH